MTKRRPNVVVVMATDVGRSPRAARHAQALRDAGCDVTVIGADGKGTWLSTEDDVKVVRLALQGPQAPPAEPPVGRLNAARALASWIASSERRFSGFGLALHRALSSCFDEGPVDLVMVMTPPCVPVVDIVMANAWPRRVPVVVDWHNLEASMVRARLATTSSTTPPSTAATAPTVTATATAATAASVFAVHEHHITRAASLHLAVTPALATHLKTAGVSDDAVVFKDAPATFCVPHADKAAARRRRDLPVDGPLLVMSSSFSVDDDIVFLRAAMVALSARKSDVRLLLTGDGPRRAEAISALSSAGALQVLWRYVDDDDYLATVGCADVAVCVHRSTSGLDFPLKLTDASAAGVPAVALDDGDGLRAGLEPWDRAARTPEAFADAVIELLEHPPIVDHGSSLTWQACWQRDVWPRLSPLLKQSLRRRRRL